MPKYLPETKAKCKQFEINIFISQCDGGYFSVNYFTSEPPATKWELLALTGKTPSWHNSNSHKQLLNFCNVTAGRFVKVPLPCLCWICL